MNEKDFPIEVFAHFGGSPEVSVPAGIKARKMPAPKEPALDPPEALIRMKAGEPTEIKVRARRGGRAPLVFASHGRKANLAGKRKMIEAARAANRKVEIHVFDKPSGG